MSDIPQTTGAVLVLGGGVAGLQAAVDCAEAGYYVYLVEQSTSIGGVMAALDKTFPTNDCSMCILSPKLVQVGRHLNIEVITNSGLTQLDGEPGNFKASILMRPRYIDMEACTGCGQCAEHCPALAIDAFNQGLKHRKATAIEYPQAVPLAYSINRDACLGCGLCENICPPKAIRYDEQPAQRELEVGAVIACPGFEPFDPALKPEYGYGRFPNVVTGLEFERMLSASGPYKGHVLRPSDGKVPRKVAWIQCVGSRDARCGNEYCSAVCCMYAIKEAVIAKEHEARVEPSIFYMDMRAYGKDFEKYYVRAKEETGVQFIPYRPSSVQEDEETGNLLLHYEDSEGHPQVADFDLVVLSTGLARPKGSDELAQTLNIELDKYGFAITSPTNPVETTREGILVAGAFAGPKDIPETVTQGSAAASVAMGLLKDSRGTRTKKQVFPEELDVAGDRPRIGVFVCHCGTNIGAYVDVPELVEYAKELPFVEIAERNLYTCSQDTQKHIVETVLEHGLNRVVVASCTPRTHEPLFRETIREAGLNPYLFNMANIRDQCSWVHMHDKLTATDKAKYLISAAIAKSRYQRPLEMPQIPLTKSAVVIGGGIAGMTAAICLADEGYPVALLEQAPALGGLARDISHTVDGTDVPALIKDLIQQLAANPLVEVLTAARLTTVRGYVGNYHLTVEHNGAPRDLETGTIVIATGAHQYKPDSDRWLYGIRPDVLTQLDLEEAMRVDSALVTDAKDIVMIQCVGSRCDERPYCSRICCAEAVKNALAMKKQWPEKNITILYRDLRTYGLNELVYEEARQQGIRFIRFDEDGDARVLEENGALKVEVESTMLGRAMTLKPDLVVLSAATVADPENEELAKFFKVPVNDDGFFLEAHVKLRPVDFATDGVFLAGLAHSPKLISEAITQAEAAAARAATVLAKDYIEAEGTIAKTDKKRCSGCGACAEACPYQAIDMDEKDGTSVVNEALCKGCGVCAATCRSEAITLQGFTDEAVFSEVRALVGIR